MKSNYSILRSFGVALLIAGGVSSHATSARADVVVTYSRSDKLTGQSGPVWQPHDYLDNTSASHMQVHGSVSYYLEPGTVITRGWGTAMDDDNYISFTLAADSGYQLNFTDMMFSTVVASGSIDSFKWGYRIDDGSGFGAWNFGTTYSIGDTGFAYVGSAANEKSWDFADFSTQGIVEFGLFAQSPTGIEADIVVTQPRNITVNGSVTAVPEPSTYGLVLGAGLAILMATHRRKRLTIKG